MFLHRPYGNMDHQQMLVEWLKKCLTVFLGILASFGLFYSLFSRRLVFSHSHELRLFIPLLLLIHTSYSVYLMEILFILQNQALNIIFSLESFPTHPLNPLPPLPVCYVFVLSLSSTISSDLPSFWKMVSTFRARLVTSSLDPVACSVLCNPSNICWSELI